MKTLELAVGLFVALGLAAFFMLAMKVSGVSRFNSPEGYTVSARFENVGGLKPRAPVTLAGVRIGRVAAINIDQRTFEAVAQLTIDPQYDQLPTDTSASIHTAGLLGEQYISLEPGGMDDYLKDGSVIKLTQSALVLEKLIGRLVTSGAGGE